MSRIRRTCLGVTLVAVVLGLGATLRAEEPVRITKFQGAVSISTPGTQLFFLRGECTPLGGEFNATGEVTFAPGSLPGSLVGRGVIVLRSGEVDVLVGESTWTVGALQGNARPAVLHLAWRDTVRLSDGSVIASRGRFAQDRPPGAQAHGIIAILIGLFAPVP